MDFDIRCELILINIKNSILKPILFARENYFRMDFFLGNFVWE